MRERVQASSQPMPLNVILALRNLFHDRLRFVATAIGIVFSVVLILLQMGLYNGFERMVSKMIDRAHADLWVVRTNTKCFEDPSLIEASAQRTISAVNGVARVSTLIIGFSDWRLSSGEMTPVFVVGSDLAGGSLTPWNIVDGSVQALSTPGTVAVDRSYDKRLGVSKLGDTAEIRGHRVQVAALTSGIRSFTTTPYVFTDLAHAREYVGIPRSMASYFLLDLKPGADVNNIKHEIEEKLKNVEVLTSGQFAARSQSFWLFGTGAGAALFGGAVLGIIVGTAIVAQTLYSSTKDHLDEFATLRAMGSSNRYLCRVIVYQALISAVIGFCLALLVTFAVVFFTSGGALPVLVTPDLIGAAFALTVLMCVGSALAAIMRVVRMDPMVVFAR